jgi:hypothetical protein
MKLFFKLYAYIGIPFAVFVGAVNTLDYGWDYGWRTGLFEGLFFGAFCALILSSLHRRQCLKIAGEELTPEQTLNLEILADSKESVFERLLEALRRFGATVRKSDPQLLTVTARVRSSWRSFGEVLSCRVVPLGDSKFEIEISSRPRFRTTLIDYGKGRLNVEGVAHFLATR